MAKTPEERAKLIADNIAKKKAEIESEQEKAKQPELELPAVSPDSRIDALEGKFDHLTSLVETIAQHLGNSPVVAEVDPPKAATNATTEIPITYVDPFPTSLEDHVPGNWLKILNQKLGPGFKFKVNDSNGDFILTMIVPKEFDRRVGVEAYSRENTPDVSVGLIHRASDLADVETWARLWQANLMKDSANYRQSRSSN